MAGASASPNRVRTIVFATLAMLVVLAPTVAADQEATWVRTSPGVWALEDSQGLLIEPHPEPGLILSIAEGEKIGFTLSISTEGTLSISDYWDIHIRSNILLHYWIATIVLTIVMIGLIYYVQNLIWINVGP